MAYDNKAYYYKYEERYELCKNEDIDDGDDSENENKQNDVSNSPSDLLDNLPCEEVLKVLKVFEAYEVTAHENKLVNRIKKYKHVMQKKLKESSVLTESMTNPELKNAQKDRLKNKHMDVIDTLMIVNHFLIKNKLDYASLLFNREQQQYFNDYDYNHDYNHDFESD